jgi:hypothetical protein
LQSAITLAEEHAHRAARSDYVWLAIVVYLGYNNGASCPGWRAENEGCLKRTVTIS